MASTSEADDFLAKTNRVLEIDARQEKHRGLQIALLTLGSLSVGASIASLGHALINRHASFPEFIAQASGLSTVVTGFLSIFIAPLWYFLFSKSAGGEQIERTADAVKRSMFATRAWITITAMAAIVVLAVSYTCYLQSRPTRFDIEFESLMTQVHEEVLHIAETRLARLKAAGARIKYEEDLLRLADLGVRVQRGWLTRSTSVVEWELLRAELNDWEASSSAARPVDVNLLIGRAQLAQGHTDLAEHTLRAALQDAKTSRMRAIAAVHLGEMLLSRRSYTDALHVYQIAMALEKELTGERLAIARRKIGICKALLRDWQGAIEEFSAAVKVADASRAIVFSNLGFALTAAQEFDRAIAALGTAIELAPTDPVPYMNLAIAHAERKDYPQARDALNLAWERTSKSTTNAGYASNEVLVRLLQAWVQLRENPAYWTGVVQLVRQSQGHLPVPEEIAEVVASRERVAQAYLHAARSILKHQNLHGLEFIAYDFLVEVREISQSERLQELAEKAIEGLPQSAVTRRLDAAPISQASATGTGSQVPVTRLIES